MLRFTHRTESYTAEITIQELKIALQNLVKTDFLTYGKTLNDYWFLPNLTKKMPKN